MIITLGFHLTFSISFRWWSWLSPLKLLKIFLWGSANWRLQLLTLFIHLFYSLKINFGDSFLCQWALTPKIAPFFNGVWINKVQLIVKVFAYAKRPKWAKGNTNEFKFYYFSGVREDNRSLFLFCDHLLFQSLINNVM